MLQWCEYRKRGREGEEKKRKEIYMPAVGWLATIMASIKPNAKQFDERLLTIGPMMLVQMVVQTLVPLLLMFSRLFHSTIR